ncbi:hypothetical protein [Gemmobacter sp.]|nr:hypothetical protein [Gemmobacter sp.]
MQTFDDKVDLAVHAAFTALGLAVASHMELAYRLDLPPGSSLAVM